MRYRLSAQAETDLEHILIEGILTFGELQALKYQDSFKRIFDLLAYMPSLGRKSERGLPDEYRFVHGQHVIYYRIDSDEIMIETIIYGPLITDLWGESDL